jgi:S-adenosylmethionine synthetase
MKRNIFIEFSGDKPLDKQKVELVERKGIGHPDSICDGIAEAVSRALSNEYMKRFGAVMHHNTDQVELVGGQSSPEWGEGEIDSPIYILLSGRATTCADNKKVPVGEIAIKAAKHYIKENLRNINVEEDCIIDQKIGMGSTDLRSVFERGGMPKANDTSFGCGFAPFTLTETLTYEVEKYMNGKMKKKIPASGEDIKVMGERYGKDITLTICNAMVSKHISDIDEYKSIIEEETALVEDFVSKYTDRKVSVMINTGDDIENGSVFLTVTGTSAEQGDDGSVGRGNRANGLITPYRTMSMEATSGKNPINHVGKLYNLLSNKIAVDLADAGAKQASVKILSQIGQPIDQPLACDITLLGAKTMEKKAEKIADTWLQNIQQMTKDCIEGKAQTF